MSKNTINGLSVARKPRKGPDRMTSSRTDSAARAKYQEAHRALRMDLTDRLPEKKRGKVIVVAKLSASTPPKRWYVAQGSPGCWMQTGLPRRIDKECDKAVRFYRKGRTEGFVSGLLDHRKRVGGIPGPPPLKSSSA